MVILRRVILRVLKGQVEEEDRPLRAFPPRSALKDGYPIKPREC